MRKERLLGWLLPLLALPLLSGAGGPASGAGPAEPAVRGPGGLPQALRILGLGDSVPAGSACACTDFVRQYATQIGARTATVSSVVNLGASGETTASLLGQLRVDPGMRRAVAGSDIVLLTIGANDLSAALDRWQGDGCRPACPTPEVAALGPAVGAVLASVRTLLGGRPALLFVTGYWNVFPDGSVGRTAYGPDYPAWSDALTRAANTAIERAAATAGAQYIDLYTPFEGPARDADPTALLAADGDHPNAAGHQLIAQVLAAAEPLQRGATEPPPPSLQ